MTGEQSPAAAVAHRHAKAWRSADPVAVAETVATFTDPDSPAPLEGAELAEHAGTVFARFADQEWSYPHVVAGTDTAVVSWELKAVHRNAYLGIPATGSAIRLAGTDTVTLRGGAAHVERTFDRMALAETLGYRTRFVPHAGGVSGREYGVSSRTSTGRPAVPGALAVTWLEVRDEDEGADVDLLSTEVVKALGASKGFLGASTFDIANRKYTITAFDQESSVRAVHGRQHQRAMRRFFRSGLCVGAFSSVWQPVRSRFFARCPDCTQAVAGGSGKTCPCGWAPAQQPFF